MSRSQFVLVKLFSRILCSAIIAGNILAGAAEPTNARPNFIVILADDQGYAELGVQGQVKDICTPNTDALAVGEKIQILAAATGAKDVSFDLELAAASACPIEAELLDRSDKAFVVGYYDYFWKENRGPASP